MSSSGMLRSVGWFRTDVSGLRIGLIFRVNMRLLGHRLVSHRRFGTPYRSHLQGSRCLFLDILTFEDGTNM